MAEKDKIIRKSVLDKALNELREVLLFLTNRKIKVAKKELRAEQEAYAQTVTADKNNLQSQINTLSANIRNQANKHEALVLDIDDRESVIVYALALLHYAVGANEWGKIEFDGTNYLDGIDNIKDALITLDEQIANL